MKRSLILIALFAIQTLAAQTRPAPEQVPWSQVDWSGCGGAAKGGTKLRISQLRRPATATSNCWPADLRFSASWVLDTRCTRCHGNDLVPGDTHLVGFLDLRTRRSMLAGGSRGPALAPGYPDRSLIYRFMMRPQYPTATAQETEALETAGDWTLGMPPYWPLPDDEKAAVRDWIAAGAPVP